MRKKVGGEIMKQVEVLVETSCNNAPKKALLRDIMIAFINDDISFLLEWLADDVSWKIIGKRTYESKRIVEKRSEEHTSELQSRENLVCRLLLEKKNSKHT